MSGLASIAPFSKARLEALSDGIFAIAMTLLVLELKVPQLPHGASTSEVLEGLRHESLAFIGFVLSFSLAGQFWMYQHMLFHFIRRANRAVAGLTLLFLMFVSLLPFSASMLTGIGMRNPVSLVWYVGNQWMLGTLLALTWITAEIGGLFDDDRSDGRRQFSLLVGLLPVGLTIPLVAAVSAPDRALYPLIFSQLGVIIISRVLGRRSRS